MHFLVTITIELFPISKSIRKEQAAKVWELQKAGVIRTAYTTPPPSNLTPGNEVLIIEGSNIDKVRELVSDLPLIKAAVANGTVTALTPYNYNEYFCPK